jgi:hypothetical protein
MTNVPRLLDKTGAASGATAGVMPHHGFRRALRRFGAALEALAGRDGARPGVGKHGRAGGTRAAPRSRQSVVEPSRSSVENSQVPLRQTALARQTMSFSATQGGGG